MDRNIKAKEELKNKKSDQLKRAKCIWPQCEKHSMMSVTLPVMEQTPNGVVEPKNNDKDHKLGVPVPMCDYHFIIAQSGMCAVVKNPDKDGEFGFIAPVDMIRASESVFNAMAFTGQLKKLIEAREKAVDVRKKVNDKIMENKNEDQAKDEESKGN